MVVWRQCSSLLVWRDLRLLIVAAVVATSIVAIGFYLARPLEDRNYGGVASGFRWSFWLSPLWIVLTIYGLRAVSHAWLRRLVELALIVSIFLPAMHGTIRGSALGSWSYWISSSNLASLSTLTPSCRALSSLLPAFSPATK